MKQKDIDNVNPSHFFKKRNQLPTEVVSAKSVNAFKNRLEKSIWNKSGYGIKKA